MTRDSIPRGVSGTGRLRLAACLLVVALTGCASLPQGPVPAGTDEAEACIALFERTDAETRAAGVGDGGAARIAGFPWLRADRLLASFRDEVEAPERFDAWVSHLAALDRKARGFEWLNLAPATRRRLQEDWQPAAVRHQLPETVTQALEHCRELLAAEVRDDAETRNALRAAVLVPDHYITWQRVLGLYPLTSRIARFQVVRLHARLAAKFDGESPPMAEWAHFGVPRDRADITPAEGAAIARRVQRDALGVPRPGPEARAALFEAHAPIWLVDPRQEADRPGALAFDADHRPVADTDEGVEYRWLSWTRFGDQVLLQLNYAIWFTERPPEGLIDIVAGHLDAVFWRTTLDAEGRVLAYDSIHACGCYYLLFPGEGWRSVTPARDQEPVLAPLKAPVPGQEERLVVELEPGTHYIVGVQASPRPDRVRALAAVPMAGLRSLPRTGGDRASVYRPDGLIPASRRLERFILWPLGVPSAGTMRQPGTHAIAFVGRRHFDDARLLERLLVPAEAE